MRTIVPWLLVVTAGCAAGVDVAELPERDAAAAPDAGLESDGGSPACAPDCADRECGTDGCGGSCGTCEGDATCREQGQCFAACTPDCGGRSCGSDGCGGSCGACAANATCDASGQCADRCTPSCAGRACGADGCGGTCGACASGSTCDSSGACVAACVPACGGRACGPDGCEGSCGACANGQSCGPDGRCQATCAPSCAGKGCGSDGCGGTCGTCPAGQSCNPNGRCVCAHPSELLIYTQTGTPVILPALMNDPAGCTQHWITIPPVLDANGDKTMPRTGPFLATIHGANGRFHAMAEFSWQAWAHVTGLSWRQKGIEFRRRMAAAGYDPAAGDTWAINELPSTVRSSATVRANAMELVQGLRDGPPGAAPIRGLVFVVGMGQGQQRLGIYKANVENWLADEPFWRAMSGRVRWWAQEVYPAPAFSCEPALTAAQLTDAMDEFAQHVPRLAFAGPASTNLARSFLASTYTPTLSAVWMSDGAYGDTRIPLAQMKRFVSLQVRSVRRWAASHAYPDGRIAFAWTNDPAASAADRADLASHLAAAVHRAYDDGGTPDDACQSPGSLTGCRCSVTGANVNHAWQTFRTW